MSQRSASGRVDDEVCFMMAGMATAGVGAATSAAQPLANSHTLTFFPLSTVSVNKPHSDYNTVNLMRRLLAFVLHATAAGVMAWGWVSLTEQVVVGEWMRAQKGGYFQFLTNQGLVISWSCMVVSLFSDLFPSVAIVRDVKRALMMISLPLEFVISSIYWSLLLCFPHLIMRSIDESQPLSGAPPQFMHLPLTTDLALHASPLFTLLIDFFVFQPNFSKTHVYKVAPVAVLVFTVWYAFFVEYCATFNGSFPYPFLTDSPFAGRILIYITTAGIALACFKTLNALHP